MSSGRTQYSSLISGRPPIQRILGALCVAIGLCLTGGYARAESNLDVLHAWLQAFNGGNAAALSAFQRSHLGDANIAFALDARDETGGFTLVRIQKDTPTGLSALLRQRNYPSLWRLTMSRGSPDALPLADFSYLPVPVPRSQALAALSAFAKRLSVADKFSGVIAVARHGRQVFAKAWGLADRASRRPVTPATPFLLASQGKMFTAVAVLQLIEQGRIGFDDPVGKYLADYPNATAAREVTVRELLTHSDGLGSMSLLQQIGGTRRRQEQFAENRAAVRSIGDIIRINGARPPAFEPGTRFEYDNYGYIVLGAIVQQVSGQSYYDYVADHVFQPAGMTHTGYPLRESMAGVAVPYSNFNGVAPQNVSAALPWRGTPAGGGVSSVGDMIRFVAALNRGKLLSATLLARAVRNEAPGAHGWYGFGFITSGVDGFPYWGHGGGAPGQSLVLDYYPLTDTTFVCMSNRDPPVCDRLAFNFLFRSRTSRHGGH